MNRNLFKKNPNQSLYRKNMVSKHTNMLDVLLIESSKHQGVNINMTWTFLKVAKSFLERNKSKIYSVQKPVKWIINAGVIYQENAFCIEYKSILN